jgi:hypothetical protein
MSEQPDCEAKPRIDAEATEALSDIDTLLATYLEPQDLQTGLQHIKDLLNAIASDNHHAA